LAALPLRALTKSALAARATWAAKTLASPRPSPLRHGSMHSQKDRTPCIRRRRTIKGRKNYAEKLHTAWVRSTRGNRSTEKNSGTIPTSVGPTKAAEPPLRGQFQQSAALWLAPQSRVSECGRKMSSGGLFGDPGGDPQADWETAGPWGSRISRQSRHFDANRTTVSTDTSFRGMPGPALEARFWTRPAR
jgi:hypothetical protein